MKMSQEGHDWVHAVLVARGMRWSDVRIPWEGHVIIRIYYFNKR